MTGLFGMLARFGNGRSASEKCYSDKWLHKHRHRFNSRYVDKPRSARWPPRHWLPFYTCS